VPARVMVVPLFKIRISVVLVTTWPFVKVMFPVTVTAPVKVMVLVTVTLLIVTFANVFRPALITVLFAFTWKKTRPCVR